MAAVRSWPWKCSNNHCADSRPTISTSGRSTGSASTTTLTWPTPRGRARALDQAKKQGKVRFVGFTGHKDPAVHVRMVQMGYPFDSVQMPLNPFDANFLSFEKEVLPELNRRGIAPLGMKPMNGNAKAVKTGVVKAEEMLRYAMSLPVTTTIAGIDSPEVLRQNLQIAQTFQPMSATDMDELRARCRSCGGRPLRAL